MTSTLADRITASAAGTYPSEAAAHILVHAIGGRLLDKLAPAIDDHHEDGRAWIDWDEALEVSGPFSSGERRLIDLAASLWAGHLIDANDTFSGLDDHNAQVVIDALAHSLCIRPL